MFSRNASSNIGVWRCTLVLWNTRGAYRHRSRDRALIQLFGGENDWKIQCINVIIFINERARINFSQFAKHLAVHYAPSFWLWCWSPSTAPTFWNCTFRNCGSNIRQKIPHTLFSLALRCSTTFKGHDFGRSGDMDCFNHLRMTWSERWLGHRLIFSVCKTHQIKNLI